jgi:hypothetical protein
MMSDTKHSVSRTHVLKVKSVVVLDELNAQSHFYPAWWTQIGVPATSVQTYKVLCSSPQEMELAKRVKPKIVKADYVLMSPDVAVRPVAPS